MRSMTGFGRKLYQDEMADITVEIKTVNHRFCDFFIKLPHTLTGLEEKIRQTANQYLARGRIEIYIRYNEKGIGQKRIAVNEELAQAYINALHGIKQLDQTIDDKINIELVAKFPEVIVIEEDTQSTEIVWQNIQPVLEEALAQVRKSRELEGANLKKDMIDHCNKIEKKIEIIRQRAPEMLAYQQDALRKKVEEYTQCAEIDEQRLLTEIVILCDKLAIDEELTRLASHLQRMRTLFSEETEAIGRKMDFIVQEVNREINTIGSKSVDIIIANQVVDIKSEIEKIREQVQNIE